MSTWQPPFDPSPEQFEVLDEIRNGSHNIVVNSVAGSGKSSLLMLIIAAIIDSHPNKSITLYAFGSRVAREWKEKLRTIGGAFGRVNVQTMHSAGRGCVKSRYGRSNVKNGKYWEICKIIVNERKQQNDQIAAQIRRNWMAVTQGLNKLSEMCRKTLTDPKDTKALWSMIDHFGLREKYSGLWADWVVGTVPEVLDVGQAQISQSMDFSDMLWIPYMENLEPKKFDFVLVDEAQDLSLAQQKICMGSLKETSRMVAVGDPKQAIMGFAGADAKSYNLLHQTLAERPNGCVEKQLTYCWRCPPNHLNLVKHIVPDIKASPGRADGEIGYADYDTLYEHLIDGDLVLSRTNAPLVSLVFKAIANGVPARMVGRDVSELLIGELDRIGDQYGFRFSDFETYAGDRVSEKRENLLRRNGGNTEDPALERINDIHECVVVIYRSNPKANSITDLTNAVKNIFADDNDRPPIMLSSVHRAKGAEAYRVFVIRRDPAKHDLLMPHPMAKQEWELEQEDNLIYVSLTRAKKELFFVEQAPFKPNPQPEEESEENAMSALDEIFFGKDEDVEAKDEEPDVPEPAVEPPVVPAPTAPGLIPVTLYSFEE